MSVRRINVAGTWWRQVRGGVDPLELRDPPPDARWQRGSVVAALYFADSPETAWAEFYRAISEYGLPLSRAMPRRLAEAKVELSGIVDLGSSKELKKVGLPTPLPSSSTWPAFQELGEAAFADGAKGLVAPSAAREGGKVLCLFSRGREIKGLEIARIREVKDLPDIPQGLRT